MRKIIYISLAIVPMLIMTIGRTAFSWSQNHIEKYDFLLYMCLFGIAMTFNERSKEHHLRDKNLFWNFSQGNWNFVVSILFACVMFFGVNSELKWVSNIHLVFTTLAILASNIAMLGYYKSGISLKASMLASAVGIGGFVFMYLWPLFTTAEAEMWVAFPILVWIIGTTKFKK